MRPHVETIQERDYVWHRAELPRGEGRASERRLSVDEEDGSSSLRIDFHTDWGRGPGIHHADTEFYVLEGEMRYGERVLGKGGYVHAPGGVPTEAIRFSEGTRILHYREYGDCGFDGLDSPTAPREEVLVHDSGAMDWIAVPNAGPMPGLFVKYLHIDPVTHFYTRLVYAEEGWADHRLAHHPCYEEAYTIDGRMSYNFGDLTEGTYFFRPARVKHGHFVAMEGGTTWLMRSDGELENWYTQNEWVRWGGDAVNYAADGGRMTWSYASHDLAGGTTWRSDKDLEVLQQALDFQHEHGAPDTPYHQHGLGPDPSLAAMPGASGGVDPASLEHPDERDGTHVHNRAAGRPYLRGRDRPVPPVISSLPVRSRSLGRWDGDGM